MNRRDELRQLDKLAEYIDTLKTGIHIARVEFAEPFWEAHLLDCADSALALIAEMRVDEPKATPRKEPTPIVLAAKKPATKR